MPKKLLSPSKCSLAREKKNRKVKQKSRRVLKAEDIVLSPMTETEPAAIEYMQRATELNARSECAKCGRNIAGRSKAHLAPMHFERTVCIPCFEASRFGTKRG